MGRECSLFNRPRHQTIARILQAFDADLLAEAQCYFAGGTAIVLALGEYRESVDIDFLCASNVGYRILRNTVSNDLGALLKTPLTHVREVRTDQYKIYTVLELDGIKVKVEIIREGRVQISGAFDSVLHVPVLSRDDLYCQKLLANADRGLDKAVMSRDLIDLAMMIRGWGDIPQTALSKAHAAYGDHLIKAFHKSLALVSDETYFLNCLGKMQMDEQLAQPLMDTLNQAAAKLPTLL